MVERTLVIVKPDGIQQRLVGQILAVFETAGLDIAGLAVTTPSRDLIEHHYTMPDNWFERVGTNTVREARDRGLDPLTEYGTDDPVRVGRLVHGWLVEYMTEGPVVAVILEGTDAVSRTRRLVGDTFPERADPESIRGRFGTDSAEAAARSHRSVRNLVHASGTVEEARDELALWFADGP